MPEELEANSGEHSDSPPLVRCTDDGDDDDDDDADTANESTQKMCKQGATDDLVVSVTQTVSAPLFCLLTTLQMCDMVVHKQQFASVQQ